MLASQCNKHENLVNLLKVLIIIYTSFSLFANILPYYDGADAFVYGISAINIAKGSFEISNELLQETGNTQYVPKQWVKTQFNTTIPIGTVGQYALAASSYIIAGYYGLFYLGPIITILLLIVTERVATKLFGSLVSLLTLTFLISDWMIFANGLQLLNDNIFAIMFILGIFFLIKFLHYKKPSLLLIASSFFAVSTFFRINGIIFLPVEVVVIIGFILYGKLKNLHQNTVSNSVASNFLIFTVTDVRRIINLQNFKMIIFFTTPWIVFIIFWLSYNSYYFGESSTNYEVERQVSLTIIYEESEPGQEPVIKEIIKQKNLSTKNLLYSFLKFDYDRFEWITFYSVALIPDPLEHILKFITSTNSKENWHADNWISAVSLIFISLAVLFSVKFKILKLEITVFIIFILSYLLFFSADYVHPPSEYPPSGGIQDRYMIPVSILSFMIFSFVVINVYKILEMKKETKPKINILRLTFITTLVIFFSVTLYSMPAIQDNLQNGLHFNNPKDFLKRFPLDKEGITEHSIVVGDMGRRTVEYGAIHLFPYEGFQRLDPVWKPENLNPQVIEDIKNFLKNGRNIYAFKKDMWVIDSKFFKFLESEHGIILKNYSDSFCKLVFVKNFTDNVNNESVPSCYSDIRDENLKIWQVWLMTPDEILLNVP